MTRYAKSPDDRVSKAISEYFDMLTIHPDCDSEVIKKASRRLSIEWQDLKDDQTKEQGHINSVLKNTKDKILH